MDVQSSSRGGAIFLSTKPRGEVEVGLSAVLLRLTCRKMMAVHHGDEPSFLGHRFADVIETDCDPPVMRDARDSDLVIAGWERLILCGRETRYGGAVGADTGRYP